MRSFLVRKRKVLFEVVTILWNRGKFLYIWLFYSQILGALLKMTSILHTCTKWFNYGRLFISSTSCKTSLILAIFYIFYLTLALWIPKRGLNGIIAVGIKTKSWVCMLNLALILSKLSYSLTKPFIFAFKIRLILGSTTTLPYMFRVFLNLSSILTAILSNNNTFSRYITARLRHSFFFT